MPYVDLHDKPFKDSTICKLEIFEDYTQAWIPAFVSQGYYKTIHIFDFFAGTGYDQNGIKGSPIRILDKLKEQIGYFFKYNIQAVVHFNEFNQKKYEQLVSSCSEYMEENNNLKYHVSIKYYNEDFEKLFPELLPEISKYPALVFLDQNGIKFLSDNYLLALEKTSKTDFIYFVSSSYFLRFGEEEEFRKHLDIDIEEAKNGGYKHIHRNITEQLRKKLPENTELKLYPFSLKKGANIYGIIFGASHPLAVHKFLDISWKRNPTNGDANFDIDDDTGPIQLELFEKPKLKKLESFQKDVEVKVLSGEIKTNIQAIEYTYSQGHIPKHATDCLIKLNKRGNITYNSRTPLISYDSVYKDKREIIYEVVKK